MFERASRAKRLISVTIDRDGLLEKAKEMLRFDEGTGKFYWVAPLRSRAQVGDVAVAIDSHGYLRISICRHFVKGHQLAFAWKYGRFSSMQIDHINGDRADNRPCNLREVTPSQNSQNRARAQSNSKSGLLGAHWDKRYKKWASEIKVNGRKNRLGQFKTAEEAHQAYLAAKAVFHPFSARLNNV